MKKRKGWRGANPRPVGLNARALPLHHVNLGDAFQFINDISQKRTNRSEWCRDKALAFKAIGHGFAPRQSLAFSHVDVGDAFQFILSIHVGV